MSYSYTASVNFGPARANLATVGYRVDGGARVTLGVAESPAGSGIYVATVELADGAAHALVWDSGQAGNLLRYAREDVQLANLNLAQPIADAKAATVGGALHGAWAVAWGKIAINALTKILSVFGVNFAGNPAAAATATFQLDDAKNPSVRNPL